MEIHPYLIEYVPLHLPPGKELIEAYHEEVYATSPDAALGAFGDARQKKFKILKITRVRESQNDSD